MRNEFGLDVDYFTRKLTRVLESVSSYKPDEMARELARLVVVADEKVLGEREFARPAPAVQVPDDWKLVPITLTREMVAYAVDEAFDGAIEDASVINDVWVALLAAAPTPAPVATEAVAQDDHPEHPLDMVAQGGGVDKYLRQCVEGLASRIEEANEQPISIHRQAAEMLRALLASAPAVPVGDGE